MGERNAEAAQKTNGGISTSAQASVWGLKKHTPCCLTYRAMY